jgi:hypothetical protein
MLEIFIVWIKSARGSRWIDSMWARRENAEGRLNDLQAAWAATDCQIYYSASIQEARLNDTARATEQSEADGVSSC